VKTIWSLSARIAAQAFLALSSYVVSVSAAHSLETGALAIFFVGWTVESMWIGAIRMVLVPALLLHDRVPRASVLVAMGALFATPLVVAVLIACRSLPPGTRWLLATSVLTLGAYEIARSLLSRQSTSVFTLPAADSALFVLALVGLGFAALFSLNLFDVALASVSGAALLLAVGIVVLLDRRDQPSSAPEDLRAWSAATWPLVRLGVLEWAVFFVTTTLGLALLGFLGGPQILAGVRLAETLVAPIGLLSSALPYVVSGALREDRTSTKRWPRTVRAVWLMLTTVTVLYLVGIQLVPADVLGILVGDHVAIARDASLGLALGVVASVFGATATLVMKHRRQVRTLSRLRSIGLAVTLPAVAIGSATGTVVGAGFGVSSSQLFPAVVQGFLHVREVRNDAVER